jgi:hypothetical protein
MHLLFLLSSAMCGWADVVGPVALNLKSQSRVTKPVAGVAREMSVRKRSVHAIRQGGPGGVAVARHL